MTRNRIIENIKEKLEKEIKLGNFKRHADAMKDYVQGVILELCEQSENFAQAVLDGDTFEECMKAVAKGCGNAISDLEVCKRAVKFYRKDTDVHFQMVLEEKDTDRRSSPMEVIDLTDFL